MIRLVPVLLILAVGCDPSASRHQPAESKTDGASSQKFEGVLTKSEYAHTKLSMIHGNYHIETSDGKLELLPNDEITEDTFESLVGHRISVTGKLLVGRTIKTSDPNDEHLQRPSEVMGDKIPLSDAIEVKTIRAIGKD
jgi:hypothetical protein